MNQNTLWDDFFSGGGEGTTITLTCFSGSVLEWTWRSLGPCRGLVTVTWWCCGSRPTSAVLQTRITQSWAENSDITEISPRHRQRSESWIGFSFSVCRKVVDMAAGVLLFVTVVGLAASGNLVKWNGKTESSKVENYHVPPLFQHVRSQSSAKCKLPSVFSSCYRSLGWGHSP